MESVRILLSVAAEEYPEQQMKHFLVKFDKKKHEEKN